MARPTSSNPQARLFVGNIPFALTREELFEVFSRIGEVSDTYMPRAKRPDSRHNNQGFAFVEMASVEGAELAIATYHKQEEVGGRQLIVRMADRRTN